MKRETIITTGAWHQQWNKSETTQSIVKSTKRRLERSSRIVKQLSSHFEPQQIEQ